MTLVTLEEAKAYLRVDTSDEDALIGSLLLAAGNLCRDVARLSDEQWAEVDSEDTESAFFTPSQLGSVRETLRVSVLYALGYLFEHREEADHHALTMTLRSLLFAVREGAV